jgi:TolB-like protein
MEWLMCPRRKRIRFIVILVLLLLWLPGSLLAKDEESIVSLKLQSLCSKIIQSIETSLEHKGRPTVAIIELENLGRHARDNRIGKIVSETLTTDFVRSGKFNVVEREQLSKVLKELQLNQTGLVDENSAKTIGKMLAADSILCGSVSEVGKFFDINVRVIDVEKATITGAAVVEIKQDDFLNNMSIARDRLKNRDKIQMNLDVLDSAIQSYSGLHSGTQSNFNVVFPKSLKELVPDYLDRLPDPIEGSWVYDPNTGKVSNSAYPEMNPTVVHIRKKPFLDAHKRLTVMSGLKQLRIMVNVYYQDHLKWPKKLNDLVPDFMRRLPNPVDGKWMYNPENGEVWHSKFKLDE